MNFFSKKTALLVLIGSSATGCATITRGTTDQVTFNSEPPGASVDTTVGMQCPSTPCVLNIPRKEEFVATFQKDGYAPQKISVATEISGMGKAALAGNVLGGGVVGIGVDAATGATLEHVPNPVNAVLEPIVNERKERPTKKSKKKPNA